MATGNYSYWKNCLTMIRAGTGITVDNSDPMKPIINATGGGGGGGIESVVAGDNVTVDDTDPLNPIINAGGGLPTICVIDAYGTDYGETGFVYSVIYNNTGRTLSAAWDEDFEGGKFIFELSGAYTDNYSCIALGSYTFTAIDMRYLGRIGSAQVGEVIVHGSDNGNPDYSVRITITIYE